MSTFQLNITKKQGQIAKVKGTIHILSYKKDDTFVIYSHHLKVFGYSTVSKEEAVNDFALALDLFFNVSKKYNTLEDALKSFGWSKRKYKNKEFLSPEIPKHILKRGEEYPISIAA